MTYLEENMTLKIYAINRDDSDDEDSDDDEEPMYDEEEDTDKLEEDE